jgi:hypothetical protein
MAVMDPTQLEAIHRQLLHLRTVRDRLAATDRIAPGTSTFWSGLARNLYEAGVRQLAQQLEAVDASLAEAIGATQRAIAGAIDG